MTRTEANNFIQQQAATIETLGKQLAEANKKYEDEHKLRLEAEALRLEAEAKAETLTLDLQNAEILLKIYQDKKFGHSSDDAYQHNNDNYNLFTYENFNPDTGDMITPVVDEAPIETTAEAVETEEITYTRKKRGQNSINKENPNIETVTIDHNLTDEQKKCPNCGEEMVCIGTKEVSKFVLYPAKWVKEIHIFHTYKCTKCECNDKSVIVTPSNDLAFPKSMASSSLVSNTMVEKYVKGVPLYRQEKLLFNQGFEFTRANMSNWIIYSMNYLKPIFLLMYKDILKNDIVLMDETTLDVIKAKNDTNYIWGMFSSKWDIPIILYFYKESREHHHASDLLTGFKGKFIQSDCYEAYDKIDGVTDVCCLAHAKRKYTDIVKVLKGKYPLMKSTIDEALVFFNKLYKIEKKLKKANASIEEIYKTRQKESVPILNDYKVWLEKKKDLFSEKSNLGKAINYSYNNFEKLKNYVLDGRLEIDNNRSERCVKSVVIGRKNWLFSFSEVGAEASCIIYSIVETALKNGLKVYDYLVYTFDEIAKLYKKYNVDNYQQLLDNYEDDLRRLLPYSSSLSEYLKVKR